MPLLSKPALTILTPTWNRRRLLQRLYASLLSQQAPEGVFEWLVIDDGSTDGSAGWLEGLIPDTPFPIRVIRQENGGKHRALNLGATHLRSPWVLIVDSDDWLLPSGIKQALRDIERACPETLIIIAPMGIIGRESREFELKEGLVNYAEWARQCQRGGVGDTSDLIRSETLGAFPFPSIEGESFLAESVVWSNAFRRGGVRFSNNRILASEYQPNGLSAGGRKLVTQNPAGAMMACKCRLELDFGISHYLRNSVNYSRYYWHALSLGRSIPKDARPRHLIFRIAGYIRFLCDRQILNLKNPQHSACP